MRFNRLEIVFNILFWVFFTWFFVFGNNTMDVVGFEDVVNQKGKILERNHTRLIAFILLQTIAIAFFYLQLYLVHRLKRPKAVKRFVLQTALLIFGMFIFQVLIIVLWYSYQELSESKVPDDFNVLSVMNMFYFAVAICYGFTKKWIQHERDKKQLELVKNQAELNLLKQQLQPHFLFNTLNNLLAMVNQTDNPKLAQSINTLSGLLRFVVYDAKSERVTIEQEIAFIKNYIELHTLRFEEDEVHFKLNVTGNFNTQKIEPGIFLCYVENAFKHGVQPEEEAFIKIDIDISIETEIHFKIENTIPKYPFKSNEGGYGISSNQERLDLAYPQKHSIYFTEGDNYSVELILHTND